MGVCEVIAVVFLTGHYMMNIGERGWGVWWASAIGFRSITPQLFEIFVWYLVEL